MQEHTLVPVADAEHRCDVAGFEVLEVAQHDHLPLRVGQLGKKRLHAFGNLRSEQAILDSVCHVTGGCAHAPFASNRDSRSSSGRPARCSRPAVDRARFTVTLNSHVLKEERPSKRSIPRTTASHVSWTTSSATARLPTIAWAARNNLA